MSDVGTGRRRVLVTGAARGIGAAVAQRYRDHGWEVVAPTRDELDLASSSAVEAFARDLVTGGGVDALVNNAGENQIREIAHLELPVWERMLAINLTAPLILTRHLAPTMAERGWGRVVNVASVYGLVGRRGRAAYSASKAGLLALTRAAAIEFGGQGILVNAVCPGFIETEMTTQNNTPDQIAALRALIPVDRLGTIGEIAEFVLFLGSERNTYVSGQGLPIDGGFLAQ